MLRIRVAWSTRNKYGSGLLARRQSRAWTRKDLRVMTCDKEDSEQRAVAAGG